MSASGPVTLDLDSTDTEVYGREKRGADNHMGQRSYDSLVATWAERRRIMAGELGPGSQSDHRGAVKVLRRALKALPEDQGPVQARMDSGFESAAICMELRRSQVGFTCSLRRSPALDRLRLQVPTVAWQPALGMPCADIAETAYTPWGWRHEPLRLSLRRVPASELSADVRSRRRRTVPKAQLELALADRVDYVYGYSFIFTELEGDAAEIELWHGQRAQIEERIKELKPGDGLIHFPLQTLEANRSWQTAAVVAHNLASMLSEVAVHVNHRRLTEQSNRSLRTSSWVAPRLRRRSFAIGAWHGRSRARTR